jgi:hypothetical protein
MSVAGGQDMGIVYLIVGWFVILTIVYLVVSAYSASVRRERLEHEWDTDPAREGAAEADRTAFIEGGMDHYRHGLRRKLIVLVYVVPMVAFAVIVYVINVQ